MQTRPSIENVANYQQAVNYFNGCLVEFGILNESNTEITANPLSSQAIAFIFKQIKDDEDKKESVCKIMNAIVEKLKELKDNELNAIKLSDDQLKLHNPLLDALEDGIIFFENAKRHFNNYARKYGRFTVSGKQHFNVLYEKENNRLFNLNHDAKRVITQKGLPLAPRFQIEAYDDQHRTWAVTIGHGKEVYAEVHTNWESNETKLNFLQYANADSKVQNLENSNRHHYLNEIERKQYEVNFLSYQDEDNNNVVVLGKGNKMLPDTPLQDESTIKYIYVITLDNKLYIGKETDVSENYIGIHHPSFVAGERVRAAGEVEIKDGKIIYINIGSGHYKPGVFSLKQAVLFMQEKGVLAGDAMVECTSTIRGENVSLGRRLYVDDYLQNVNMLEDKYGVSFYNKIKEINQYLSQRAKETRTTSSFLGYFIGYSSNDYRAREKDWIELLSLFSAFNPANDNLEEIKTKLIDMCVKYDTVTGTSLFGSRRFTQLLDELLDLIAPRDNNNKAAINLITVLRSKEITEYITTSQQAHQKLKEASKEIALCDEDGDETQHLKAKRSLLSQFHLLTHGKAEFLSKADARVTVVRNKAK